MKQNDSEITIIDKATRRMLLAVLKRGYFDKETSKDFCRATKNYTCRLSHNADIIKIERCLKKPIELDREIKLTIISAVKKGYFEKQAILPIRKKINEASQIGSQDELRQVMFDLLKVNEKDEYL